MESREDLKHSITFYLVTYEYMFMSKHLIGSLSPLVIQLKCADPEGRAKGSGRTPPFPENHKLYGFLYGISNCISPLEKVGPPSGKYWTLSGTLEKYSFL